MKRVLLPSIVLVLLVALVFCLLPSQSPSDVVYQGKLVVEWALDLNSPSPTVRENAAQVVHSFEADAIPALVQLLRTPDPVLARPVKALAWRAPRKVAGVLFRMVDPYSAPVKRSAAAQALRGMGARAYPAIPALARALGDDQTVSWHAALALAQLGPEGVAALTAALGAAPPAQAGFICYALGTAGPSASNAVPVLVTKLQSTQPDLAERASVALAAVGPAAVRPLIEVLASPDPKTRTEAIGALSRIGPLGRPAVPKLIECARSADQPERLAAVEALGQIQPTAPSVVATLARSLKDPLGTVRVKALEGLGRSPRTSQAAVAAIRAALEDESAAVRERATNLLSQMGVTSSSAAPPEQH